MYFVEKSKGFSYTKQFDYPLFFAVLALSIIGVFIVNSATRVMPNGADGNRIFYVQIVGLVIGILVSLIISIIDYKDLKNFAAILYVGSVALLVLVRFIGVGDHRSVFDLKIVTFQPSELAKVVFIVFTAVFFDRIAEGTDKLKNIVKLTIYAAVPVALILAQPDVGTAIVFICIFGVMVYICGIKYKYIIGALLASVPVSAVLWLFVLEDFQKNRIIALFSAESGAQTFGLNLLRAKMAIGSGQLFGKGLFQGIQTQHASVPVKESDFIFTVIGEELGFIGAVIVVLLIAFILMRCLYIAKHSRDKYGSFLAVGVLGMLGFHFIENIGMCIGILPVTGIPLPFVSAGGSALVTYYMAIGVVLSVSMRRSRAIFNSTQ